MRTCLHILFFTVIMAIGIAVTDCQTACAQPNTKKSSIDNLDYILIITSYSHDSKQVSDFLQELDTDSDDLPFEIKIESMGVVNLDDCNKWHDNMLTIIHRQNMKHLKAVIVIGQEAWGSYISLGDQRPDKPFFATKISENGLEIPTNLQNSATWEPMSVSNRKLVERIGYGGTEFHHYDVEANVNLIKDLFPKTQNIALITDNTYGGISIHAYFRRIMHERFGDIKAITIDGRQLSIGQIQEAISSLPPNTALLLGTWRVDYKGTFITDRLLSEVVASRPDLPIFSLTGIGLRDIAIAGIVPEYETPISDFTERVFQDIEEERKDTFFMSIPSMLNVNMGNLRKMRINEKRLPKHYKIVDQEKEKVVRYRRYLISGGIILAVMLLMLTYAIRMSEKTKKQNELLNRQAKELKIAKERAEVSDKLKTAFLANISHEIRTPLNAIEGFTSLINQSQSIDNVKEYLKYISDSTDKLLRLLTLIVDFAKVDSGIIEFNMVKIDLSATFNKIKQHFAQRLPENIRLDCCTPYDCTIEYDREKLEQIISILLDNAIKFTRNGVISMGYFATPTSIKIYVNDTGIGIQEKNISKIFDKFAKLSIFSDGTGIGLSLVKTLVEKTGGNIQVVSRPEAGSRFIVEIPCEPITNVENLAEYDRTDELLNADTLIIDKQLAPPLKILVAEDNPQNFVLLKSILNTHDLTHVTNGLDAVKALQNDWYDIVFMDIRMPEMDGITATSEIRKFDLSTPIIAVTAFSPDDYKRQAKKAGCDYFIEKPFTRSKLYNAILGLMNSQ